MQPSALRASCDSLPKVLRVIGEESIQKATHKLSSKRIDQIIKAARKKKNRC